MSKNKGFTLIELLVVIAIIGLLSTMAVVSLNSARGKARDAQRLSDVKQLSTVIEMAAASQGTYDVLSACEVGDLTTDCGTLEGNNFENFYDPVEAQRGTACDTDNPAPCGYTLLDLTDTSYEICFWLELETGNLSSGLNSVSEGSRVAGGCTDID